MHEEFPERNDDEVYSIEDFKKQYPFAYKMELQIAHAFDNEDVKMQDVLMLMRNLMARSRAILTFDELHGWLHKLLKDAEILLQTGQAFVDEDGNEVNMMLAEEREVLGTADIQVPDTVPEDWA